MSCTCKACGRKYKVDIMISNKLWEKITPDGLGMLCGQCIITRIEKLNRHDYFFLTKERAHGK